MRKEKNALTVLYTVIAVTYFMVLFLTIIVYTDEFVRYGRMPLSIYLASITVTRLITFCTAIWGIKLTIQEKMTLRATRIIMCVPFIIDIIQFLSYIIDFYFWSNSGNLTKGSWIVYIVIPLIFLIYVFNYFTDKKYKLPYEGIIVICIYSGIFLIYNLQKEIASLDLALSVLEWYTTLTFIGLNIGNAAMIGILGYQGYLKKRRGLMC